MVDLFFPNEPKKTPFRGRGFTKTWKNCERCGNNHHNIGKICKKCHIDILETKQMIPV